MAESENGEPLTDAKTDKWFDRLYTEKDFGTNIAIAAGAGAGLIMYLSWDDWTVALFGAAMVFPIVKVLASAAHSHWNESRRRKRTKRQLQELFYTLGHEERSVVDGFVRHGGSVITWNERGESSKFSDAGIESLINRQLVREGFASNGSESFALDPQMYDYAQEVMYRSI